MNLLHAIFEPVGEGPHPTIIALHGWGANAMDLLGLAPHLAGGRFLVLCPQGPLQFEIGPNATGYGWFPLSGGGSADPAAVHSAVDSLVAFVDAAQRRYPIAADKLALLGFSQGGVMAYALALRQRQRFAALAALSTWLPAAMVEPGADLDRLPVLVQHGLRDPMIPAERGQESVTRLRQLNANVVYREYEMGHEINAKSLTDLVTFLGEKVVSPIITL